MEYRRWQEWMIVVCLLALAGAAMWTVFGEDLRDLVSGQPDKDAPRNVHERAQPRISDK
jgi:hypothetical protein